MLHRQLMPYRTRKRANLVSDSFDPFVTFDHFLNNWSPVSSREEQAFHPALDVIDEDKMIQLSVELPGLEEADIDVSLKEDVLTIQGEKKQTHEETQENYFRNECRYGSFYRAIKLPLETIDTESIEAKYKNGVLTVTIPKKEVVEPEATKIQITS